MELEKGKHEVDNNLRQLTDEEKKKLEKDVNLVTEFKQMKLEKEAKKNWDLFYKRNSTNFFKDRHWTTREFQELCSQSESNEKKILLEVGCGVGNFIFPLIEEIVNLFIYACDFSPRAINFVKENPLYDVEKCCAFCCDITKDSLQDSVKDLVDFVSLIFVMSAIHPQEFVKSLRNIHSILKPGGVVLFRDYGLYDAAMLKFKPGHKLMDNFYVRQDNTRAYYFSTEMVAQLFSDSGFEILTNNYVHRRTINVKEEVNLSRTFVQGKFRKKF